jgi:hypothetical protein
MRLSTSQLVFWVALLQEIWRANQNYQSHLNAGEAISINLHTRHTVTKSPSQTTTYTRSDPTA